MAVVALKPRRGYSFTDHATSNPSAPPPGDRLDGEVDRLGKAVSDTIDWAATSLNANGTLRPGTVGLPQLEPGIFDDIAAPAAAAAAAAEGFSEDAAAAAATTAAAEKTAAAAERTAGIAAATASDRNEEAQAAAGRASSDAQDAAASAAEAAQSALEADASATAALNSANHADLSEAVCTDYGVLTQAWAEHMPDTIPPNILAVMDVTGDHWSSRWWANRAHLIVEEDTAQAICDLQKYWLGAYPAPPVVNNCGEPVVAGAMYYNTAENVCQVYDGLMWHDVTQPVPGQIDEYLYLPLAPTTVFSGVDYRGNTLILDPVSAEIAVYLNGVKLLEGLDYSVAPSEITMLLGPVTTPNTVEIMSVSDTTIRPPAQGVKVNTTPWVFDGVAVTFPLADSVGGVIDPPGAVDCIVSLNGVIQEAGGDFTVTPGFITFTTAPEADADRWMVVGLPLGGVVTATASEGTVTSVAAGAGIAVTPSPITAAGTVSLAAMPAGTLKGNNTGASAVPSDLTAAQTMALLGAASLDSPAFTGNPTAPTPSPGDSDISVATTAFVAAAVAAGGGGGLTEAAADLRYVNIAGDTMTGPLVMPVGSVSATSINFGTAGTGFSGSGAQLTFSTAGTQRVNITSSDVTFAPRISANTGSAIAASIHFGTSNTGFYGGTTISATVGGANKLTLSSTNLAMAVPIGLQASTTGAAPLNVPHGTAPSAPVNGDLWTTTLGLYARVNGATVGPFGAGGGSGISELTGDVTAGPGSGSQAATLASIATPGSFTNADITIDAKGRVTAAANGAAAAGGVVPHPGYRSGNIYTRPMTVGGANTAVIANTIYLWPIFIAHPVVMTGLQIFVGTLIAGGQAEIGIWANNNGVPGALLRDVGTVSTASTGVKEVTGVNFSAAAGWYWFGVAFSAGCSVTNGGAADQGMGFFIGAVVDMTISFAVPMCYRQAWTFAAGALPGTIASPVPSQTNAPIICFRAQ